MTEDEMIEKMVSEAVRAHRKTSKYSLDEGQVKSIVEAVRPLIEARALRHVCKITKEFSHTGLGVNEMMNIALEFADELEDGVWADVTNLTPDPAYSNYEGKLPKIPTKKMRLGTR
jgi:hypothetical protein